LIDAATFIFAGAMVALVTVSGKLKPRLSEEAEQTALPRLALWQEWGEGLRLVWREPVVTILFAMTIMTSVGEGVFSVIFIIWVTKVFGGGALELGWFMTAQGVGGILGGLIIGWLGRKLTTTKLLGLGGVLLGTIDLVIFNYPRFFPEIWPGLILIFLVGIPAVSYGVSWTTLLQ
jgi:Na+/melibiose symporter-like transporter